MLFYFGNNSNNDLHMRTIYSNQPETTIVQDGGSIWTTRDDCGNDTQNVNEYDVGDEVFINGANFDINISVSWDITGAPGSCDPSIVVASGSYDTGPYGEFCFSAYVIQNDDCGIYHVDVDGKNDNFNVNNTPTNSPPLAFDDYASVSEGGSVSVLLSSFSSVLDNDTDPDGDILSAYKLSDPSYGIVTINSDGTFSYSHDGSETLADSLSYEGE
jgi:hypothetical protein